MTKDLAGKRFEKQVLKTLKAMGIKCYGDHGRISFQAIHPRSQRGRPLEIEFRRNRFAMQAKKLFINTITCL